MCSNHNKINMYVLTNFMWVYQPKIITVINLIISTPQVTRSSKHVLPHLARLCLVSTFFEDGIRMWVQWSEQREYMDISWGCGWFIATLFVVINLLGQLGGVAMVMLRLKVDIACGILFGIVFLQVLMLINYKYSRTNPLNPRHCYTWRVQLFNVKL